MENLDQFNHQLPAKIKEMCEFIVSNGFRVGIVGGVTRDFILNSKISTDIDCEIRPILADEFEKWPLLFEKLKDKYKNFEELPFNILRLQSGEYSIEISLPRIEEFDGTSGHSNFIASFIPDIDYKRGFERRDLTINTIMFEFDGLSWKLIDPMNGIEDLKNKIIRNCSSHFFFDPVRFLRGIRFALKFKFEIHPDTLLLLETMNIEGLSSHYLKTELIKSNRPLYMIKRIHDLRKEALGGLNIQVENKSIVSYDKLFDGNLEVHIRQAVFLSVEVRSKILDKLGMSFKSLIPSITIQHSWKSLANEDYESENFKLLTEIISKLESLDLDTARLTFLLNHFEIDLDLEDFYKLKDSKYELSDHDKEIDQSKYRYLILQKRLKTIL
jgi:hypothetical protein